MCCWLLRFAVLCSIALAAGPAQAQRWVSAYDPALHAKPPTMKGVDGQAGLLVWDGDLTARARSLRQLRPDLRAAGALVQHGEVVIIEGSEETLDAVPEGGYRVKMPAVARKVIEKFGDKFQAMTLWLTFDETSSSLAEAYEFTVRTDVRGLGMALKDNSGAFGSQGTLRSILNMKRVWRHVSQDSAAAWRPHLETWGQESGHRWMVFMRFRDPRTGMNSDAMLGRQCSHYNRFVDTQGSVHDGYAWKDMGNGTFEVEARNGYQFGNLDLYGMGLLAADELPSFFLIDDLPNYQHVPCGLYDRTPGRPGGPTVTGTRVDISAEDIIAANGPRIPSSDELLAGQPQDYFREAQVIVTRPEETAASNLPVQVAGRVDRARLLWEDWMRAATGNRMVVCTKLSADCGDARSDVRELRFNAERKSPAAGPLTLELVVDNGGDLEATGVEAQVATTFAGESKTASKTVGSVPPKDSRLVAFDVDVHAAACGTEIQIKAATKSNFHRHRRVANLLVGTESPVSDGFEAESGWRIDPDGNDSSQGALWERGTPAETEVVAGKVAQPEGAHGGSGAFVTGAVARGGARDPFVHNGRTTLESPMFDGSAWREPRLRYWVSFAGMQASRVSGGVDPSPNARLLVLARRLGAGGGDGGASTTAADAGAATDWIEVDRLENVIAPRWVQRTVMLPAALAGGPVKLRFVAEDANPQSGGVEAAIDDVEITSNLPACYERPPETDGGCGCALASAGRGGGGLTALLLATLAALRARRRR